MTQQLERSVVPRHLAQPYWGTEPPRWTWCRINLAFLIAEMSTTNRLGETTCEDCREAYKKEEETRHAN